MKKRVFSLLFALALLCALIPAAHADMIWEPDNDFYESHQSECVYVNRSYYANGDEGYVTLWDAPKGSIVTAQYENSTRLTVCWQYEDWGCVDVYSGGSWISGWVPMEDLLLIYDSQAFCEDHQDEIRSYDGEFADYDGECTAIVFWAYPGAPDYSLIWTYGDISDQLTGSVRSDSYISKIYVDDDGRTWGYVAYLYGRLELWFCLDDPTSEDLTVSEPENWPYEEQIPDVSFDGDEWDAWRGVLSSSRLDDPNAELVAPAEPQLPTVSYLPWILVGAVTLLTAALLVLLLRKKRATEQEK